MGGLRALCRAAGSETASPGTGTPGQGPAASIPARPGSAGGRAAAGLLPEPCPADSSPGGEGCAQQPQVGSSHPGPPCCHLLRLDPAVPRCQRVQGGLRSLAGHPRVLGLHPVFALPELSPELVVYCCLWSDSAPCLQVPCPARALSAWQQTPHGLPVAPSVTIWHGDTSLADAGGSWSGSAGKNAVPWLRVPLPGSCGDERCQLLLPVSRRARPRAATGWSCGVWSPWGSWGSATCSTTMTGYGPA